MTEVGGEYEYEEGARNKKASRRLPHHRPQLLFSSHSSPFLSQQVPKAIFPHLLYLSIHHVDLDVAFHSIKLFLTLPLPPKGSVAACSHVRRPEAQLQRADPIRPEC